MHNKYNVSLCWVLYISGSLVAWVNTVTHLQLEKSDYVLNRSSEKILFILEFGCSLISSVSHICCSFLTTVQSEVCSDVVEGMFIKSVSS